MSGRRARAALPAVATIGILAVLVVVVVSGGRRHPSAVRTVGPGRPSKPVGPVGPGGSGEPLPGRPAPAGEVFGVSVNRLFNDLAYTSAQIAAQLGAVRAAGATVARSDALWEAAEPHAPAGGSHTYDWSFDDQIASALAAHQLTWLPILDYSAPWAESVAGQDHSPPRSDADYAEYAGAFAARYGAGGSFWQAHPALTAAPVTTIEIWNEPDNGQFWVPGPNAGAYATLYLAARTAVDAVNPGIRVIVGGLTEPQSFLPEMVRAEPGLRGHVDGVAIHPYGPPGVVVSKVRGARAALVALGMSSVPLYITEFGWTTDPPSAPDYAPAARRPGYITTTLAALGHLDCGLAAVLQYTWVTPERDRANSQDWYGIADPANPAAGTPVTAAFSAGLKAAAAAESGGAAGSGGPAGSLAPCAR